MLKILGEFIYNQRNFTKIILYDLGEIGAYTDDFIVINRIIVEKCDDLLDIETIRQGSIKQHFNWHYNYFENCIEFKFTELCNEKYFIDMEALKYE